MSAPAASARAASASSERRAARGDALRHGCARGRARAAAVAIRGERRERTGPNRGKRASCRREEEDERTRRRAVQVVTWMVGSTLDTYFILYTLLLLLLSLVFVLIGGAV